MGTVSIGVSGSAWRRRQYAVLVVDRNQRIVHVEQLSGWTVMADLRPVQGLNGRPMSDLLEEGLALPVPDKLLRALQNAAGYIRDGVKPKGKVAQTEDKPKVSVTAD